MAKLKPDEPVIVQVETEPDPASIERLREELTEMVRDGDLDPRILEGVDLDPSYGEDDEDDEDDEVSEKFLVEGRAFVGVDPGLPGGDKTAAVTGVKRPDGSTNILGIALEAAGPGDMVTIDPALAGGDQMDALIAGNATTIRLPPGVRPMPASPVPVGIDPKTGKLVSIPTSQPPSLGPTIRERFVKVTIRGVEHEFDSVGSDNNVMLMAMLALLALDDPKIDAVLGAFGLIVASRDGDVFPRDPWPEEGDDALVDEEQLERARDEVGKLK